VHNVYVTPDGKLLDLKTHEEVNRVMLPNEPKVGDATVMVP
jgi:hypothetical protein